MIRLSEAVGRQITVREGGQDVGKVKDLIVDPSGQAVIGILVTEGVFSGSKVIPWKAVQAVGTDNIIVDAAGSVTTASSIPQIKTALDRRIYIKGLRLVTTKGKDLGKIVDCYVEESTGAITGFELGGRRLSSEYEGTPFLPTPAKIELGKDVAFVEPEIEGSIVSGEGTKNLFKRGKAEEAEEAPTAEDVAPPDV